MMYSDVYDRLVSDKNDVVGHVAYGVYKQAKLEFIKRKKLELQTDTLPDDLMEEFIASQTDYTLSLYRRYANEITHEFLEEELENLQGKTAMNIIKKISPKSWWYGVTQSLAASFLFLLAGYVLLKMSGSWDILLNNLLK